MRNKSLFILAAAASLNPISTSNGLSLPNPNRNTNTNSPSSTASSSSSRIPNQPLAASLSQLRNCNSATSARRVLSNTFSSNPKALYNSLKIPKGASELSISDADLAIQTNIRNSKYSIMQLIELNGDKDADRASLFLFSLFVSTSVSALVAQQNMPGPDILRFTVVWLLCFAPFFFIGYGIATPEALQGFLVSLQRYIFPLYRKRMVHHEAGHFLIAHLLGFPIRDYQANAVKNAVEFYPMRDEDRGREKASLMGFDSKNRNRNRQDEASEGKRVEEYYPEEYMDPNTPFFAEGGRGDAMLAQSVFRDGSDNSTSTKYDKYLKLAPRDDVKKSWPYRGFDHATLDQLAAVSVAGVCSEIIAFGNAEGGYADLAQLRVLFAGAEPGLNDKDMDNRVRYAIGYAMGQLRRHLGALDDLVDAMDSGASVEECVLVIEACENVSGATVSGNYEKIRRGKIQNEGVGFVESLLLGGGKNADSQDNSVIEGKGGGDRQQKFQLTGDDPLYAALGAALLFFVFASTGGLSLH